METEQCSGMYYVWTIEWTLPCSHSGRYAFIKLYYICYCKWCSLMKIKKQQQQNKQTNKTGIRPKFTAVRPPARPLLRLLLAIVWKVSRHTQLKGIRECCALIFKETKIHPNILDQAILSMGGKCVQRRQCKEHSLGHFMFTSHSWTMFPKCQVLS